MDEFLHSDTNKEQLINIIKEYIISNEGNEIYEFPIIVTAKSKTYKISSRTTTEQFECNYGKADSRLVLHATLEDTDVVIVSKDTDVLVLMVWAYVKNKIERKWFMKYDDDKFADIAAIAKFLGRQISLHLPAIHALGGCDTTFFLQSWQNTSITQASS